MKRLAPSVVMLVVFAVLAVGCASSGETPAKESVQTAPAKPKRNVATKASFTRCLERAGVAFDSSGAVPVDPTRTRRPRGFQPPAEGRFAKARYIGAASFQRGGFTDVWITPDPARAKDLAVSFEDPSLNEPRAKNWYFENVRNILFAIHADETGVPGDPTGTSFDKCLRHG